MQNLVRTRSINYNPEADFEDRFESVLKEPDRTRLFIVALADLI